jgi:hypothetical protein
MIHSKRRVAGKPLMKEKDQSKNLFSAQTSIDMGGFNGRR